MQPEMHAKGRHWLSSRLVQIPYALILAVAAPVWLGVELLDHSDIPIIVNSGVAGGIALVLGILAFRRVSRIPGISALGNLVPSIAFAYLFVIAVMFFSRIDYSRAILASTFILGLGVVGGMQLYIRRRRSYRMAVVPIGELDALSEIIGDRMTLVKLESPEDSIEKCDGIIADFRADLPEAWERLLMSSVLLKIPVYHVKNFVEQLTGKVDIEHLSENSLGAFDQHGYLDFRSFVERVLAAIALALLMPLFVLVAVLIKIDSPGPVIFSQYRAGQRGQRFRVFKFRTMAVDPESDDEDNLRAKAMTADGDKRITRLGKFLRRSRIDELPQIVNILRGEMSVIGPRPEALALSEWYEGELPFYRYRHMVRPGITGWAQVCQGHVTDLTDIHDKLRFDFYYIKNLSLWLDLVILARTIRTILTGFGAR